jgi:hypothetical protein
MTSNSSTVLSADFTAAGLVGAALSTASDI